MKDLILASTSVYRQALLKKTGLAFRALAPKCDEDSFKSKGLSPKDLAVILAKAKSESIFAENQNAVVIGSDQVLEFEGKHFGKAGSAEKAVAQLKQFSGKSHRLLTAVCVQSAGQRFEHLHVAELTMRKLTEQDLLRYVNRDRSWDCAGSYKIEESGIVLFDKIQTEDWSGIQGLPLLWLTATLHKLGFEIPT